MIVGLGIDIIEIDRIAKARERWTERFMRRILTDGERKYCGKFADPAPEIAARFAAKEAFTKAIGTGITRGVGWKDIEVIKERGKPPFLRVRGRALEFANLRGINNIHLSLTHAQKYAAAVVVVEKVKKFP